MKSKLAVLLTSVAGLSVPFLASAQGVPSCASASGTIQGLICTAGNILSFVLPVVIALGVIIFIWGVVQFVIASDEEAKTKGRNMMIYGIIGLVVIVALWGIVRIVTNTLGLGSTSNLAPPAPELPY